MDSLWILKKMTEPLNKDAVLNQIKNLKEYLRYDTRYSLPRPFNIEFAGPPSVGKTSVIAGIDDFLRPLGLGKIWPPQEGPREIRHIPRSTPDYNIRTAMYSLTKLLDESHDSRYDLILFDRCAFDAYCWMEYWEKKGKLSPGDKFIFQSYFTSRQFTEKIDICYFLVCDPNMSMNREFKDAISDDIRETTNLESIKMLDQIWRRTYALQHSFHPNLRLIDTTNINVSEMTRMIVKDILTTLEAKSTHSIKTQG